MTLLIFRLHWSKVKQAWLPPTKTVLWISVSCYLTFWFSLIPGLAMVLTAAFEFDPRSNKEATIRPTDNIEVPQVTTGINKMCLCYVLVWEQLDQKRNGLSRIKKNKTKQLYEGQINHNHHKQPLLSVLQLIRELGNINVKKKEPPFCYPYSLKARVLVLAHLARMDVSEELEEGKTLKFDTKQSLKLFYHLRLQFLY